MRGDRFLLRTPWCKDEDNENEENKYEYRTDSYASDPFYRKGTGENIGQITEKVAILLFPELSNGPDILYSYTDKPRNEIQAAWEQVLAEHDEEQKAVARVSGA